MRQGKFSNLVNLLISKNVKTTKISNIGLLTLALVLGCVHTGHIWFAESESEFVSLIQDQGPLSDPNFEVVLISFQ